MNDVSKHRSNTVVPTSKRSTSTLNTHLKLNDDGRPPRLFQISSADLVIVTLLTLVAAFTRLYRIKQPSAVVFDEVHFSKFCDRLLTGTWFFDIHPPLGKLILAFGGHLLGYRPDPTFVIKKVGHEYPEHIKYWLMRYVSALFSVLTVPAAYAVGRLLRISATGSVLSAGCVLFDFIGLMEGRLILMDSQLLFFCQLSLACALVLWRTRYGTRQRVVWLVLTGVTAGLALSIKHTALATPGLIAVVSFFGIHFLPMPLTLSECAAMAVTAITVYTAPFYVMFRLLIRSGDRYDMFMPVHFRKTLIGAKEFDASATRAPFHQLFVYLNRRMVASNAGIVKRHNWESKWYQWIVNWRGVLLYSSRDMSPMENGQSVRLKTQLYLFGNPVVAALIVVCVASFALALGIAVRYRNHIAAAKSLSTTFWNQVDIAVFLVGGWLANLLPYILVDRAAFIYHYLPGMFYGQLLCGLAVDGLPPKLRVTVTAALLAAMVGALVYWSPWIFGMALTDAEHVKRRWLPRWN